MMRPLWLDFQQPAPGRHRAGLVLLLAGLLASGLLLADYVTVGAAEETVRAQVSQLRSEGGARRQLTLDDATGGSDRGGGAGTGSVGDLGTAPGYSAARWATLFDALEAATDESVTLLGLQPGPREVRLNAEARDVPAALDYLKRLQAVTAFAGATLTQSEIVQEHPQHPVRFALTLAWPGATK